MEDPKGVQYTDLLYYLSLTFHVTLTKVMHIKTHSVL